jgi:hypothetical protein
MRIEDFLHNRSVPLKVRIGTLLSGSASFGDIDFIVQAETLLEEYDEEGNNENQELKERLVRAKTNREIKINKISQN